MHDVDEGKAVLDFRVGCHRHQPRSLHCPRNCSLSLSLSLSLGCKHTHTHTHTRRDHCCCSFFSRVINFRTYRVACLTFVWHFLFIVTRMDTLFFSGLSLQPSSVSSLNKILFQSKQSFFTSVKGLAKSESRSTHARTRPRPNCQPARHNKRAYEITPRWSLAFFTEA